MDGSVDDDKMIKKPTTLVIGDLSAWGNAGRSLPDIDGFHFADVGDINPTFISRLSPGTILSSLVARDFDAIEIAKKLDKMEFDGSYRVIAKDIPNIKLILQEVRYVAPHLDFDIIDLSKHFP